MYPGDGGGGFIQVTMDSHLSAATLYALLFLSLWSVDILLPLLVGNFIKPKKDLIRYSIWSHLFNSFLRWLINLQIMIEMAVFGGKILEVLFFLSLLQQFHS
eukprot:c23915_g1_i2 orf=3-305(-)